MDSEKSYKKEESDFIPGDSSPEPQQESRIKRKKKKNQKLSQLCLKQGRWELQQEEIYISFLRNSEELFHSEHDRRSNKVFDQLSKLLDNKRTPDQCRSHHYKMWKKTKFSKNFSDIIRHLESKYEGKLLGDKVGKEEKKTNESELILSEEKIGYKIEVGLGEGIKIDLNLDLRFFKVW